MKQSDIITLVKEVLVEEILGDEETRQALRKEVVKKLKEGIKAIKITEHTENLIANRLEKACRGYFEETIEDVGYNREVRDELEEIATKMIKKQLKELNKKMKEDK
jgi:uncharacterized membrane-anchored protein YjiN (DUF445 family)